MKRLLFFIILTSVGCFSLACSPKPKPPNFVLIIMDSWRYDCFSPEITPTIWRLAEEGISFPNYYVNAGYTSASVPTILSSQYPQFKPGDHATNLTGFRRFWKDPGPEARKQIPPNLVTLPEILKDHGFRTMTLTQNPNTTARKGYGPRQWDDLIQIPTGKDGGLMLTMEAVKKVREMPPDTPFFLMLLYMDAHGGYNSSTIQKEDRKIVSDFLSTKSTAEHVPTAEELELRKKLLPFAKEQYIRGVKYVDSQVAQLMKEPILRDSIIFITADHGEMFNEIGEIHHRGHLSEEIVHVPLVVWGKAIEPARDVRAFESVDLMPTILALANINQRVDMKGQNLFSPSYEPRDPIIAASWLETAYISSDKITRIPLKEYSPTDAEHREQLRALGYLD